MREKRFASFYDRIDGYITKKSRDLAFKFAKFAYFIYNY